MTQSGATILDQSEPIRCYYSGPECTFIAIAQGAMALKGYSTFLKASALLEPYHQIV